jgi:predicted lipoprotein DUF2279
MLRIGVAWLLIAVLHSPVRADAPAPEQPPPDPSVTVPAKSPWIDLAPTEVLEKHAQPVEHEDHKVAAAVTLSSMYAVFIGWTYVAWYRKHHPLSQYKWGGDGWLGDQTYAGGADKFGHAWSTMSLARLGTEMLDQWGGYDRTTANVVSTLASELLFTGVEVKDGFYYEFSFSDLTGDTLGALAGFALSQWPRLDEMFDYRVQYWPSTMYQRKVSGASPCPAGSCSTFNIAEDYSGETYMLAFHLGSIHALRDMKYGTIARFIDVAAGFGTRNYKPDRCMPPQCTDAQAAADLAAAPGRPTQELMFGITLNAQGLFDYLLEGRSSKPARVTRKMTHGLFEVFNLPFTYLSVEHDHSPCPTCPVNVGGA